MKNKHNNAHILVIIIYIYRKSSHKIVMIMVCMYLYIDHNESGFGRLLMETDISTITQEHVSMSSTRN